MYLEIEVMNRNKELPIIKHIETNYITFWKQQIANITKFTHSTEIEFEKILADQQNDYKQTEMLSHLEKQIGTSSIL